MTAVGIDVGKSSLDVAIEGTAAVTRFANSVAGIRKLLQHLSGVTDARIVVEATGGYEDALVEACCDADLWVSRINPRQARDFARRPVSWPRANAGSVAVARRYAWPCTWPRSRPCVGSR